MSGEGNLEAVIDNVLTRHGEESEEESEMLRSVLPPLAILMKEEMRRKDLEASKCFPVPVGGRADVDAVTVLPADVRSLNGEKWLTGNVIDFYLRYLKSQVVFPEEKHFFSYHFYGMVAKEINGDFAHLKRHWKNIDILKKAYLFIPIADGTHFSLLVACNHGDNKWTLLHMDSLRSHNSSVVCENIRRLLTSEFNLLNDSQQRKIEVEVGTVEVPQQKNSFDCGVFTLCFAETFLNKTQRNIKPQHLDVFKEESWCKFDAGLRQKVQEHMLALYDEKDHYSLSLINVITPFEKKASLWEIFDRVKGLSLHFTPLRDQYLYVLREKVALSLMLLLCRMMVALISCESEQEYKDWELENTYLIKVLQECGFDAFPLHQNLIKDKKSLEALSEEKNSLLPAISRQQADAKAIQAKMALLDQNIEEWSKRIEDAKKKKADLDHDHATLLASTAMSEKRLDEIGRRMEFLLKPKLASKDTGTWYFALCGPDVAGRAVIQSKFHSVLLPIQSVETEYNVLPSAQTRDSPKTRGIIFVVDGQNKDMVHQAKTDLQTIMQKQKTQLNIPKIPLLVVANKKEDLHSGLAEDALAELLDLPSFVGRIKWKVQNACVSKGEGLDEGFDWLLSCHETEEPEKSNKQHKKNVKEDAEKEPEKGNKQHKKNAKEDAEKKSDVKKNLRRSLRHAK